MFKFGPTKPKLEPTPTNRWVAIEYAYDIVIVQVHSFGGKDFYRIYSNRDEWKELKEENIVAEETR